MTKYKCLERYFFSWTVQMEAFCESNNPIRELDLGWVNWKYYRKSAIKFRDIQAKLKIFSTAFIRGRRLFIN